MLSTTFKVYRGYKVSVSNSDSGLVSFSKGQKLSYGQKYDCYRCQGMQTFGRSRSYSQEISKIQGCCSLLMQLPITICIVYISINISVIKREFSEVLNIIIQQFYVSNNQPSRKKILKFLTFLIIIIIYIILLFSGRGVTVRCECVPWFM